jgi:hypothetical protein
MSGYSRTSTGQRYQSRVVTNTYGDAYWQSIYPDENQRFLDTRRVEIQRIILVNYINIIKSGNTIPVAGMLLESDVNARVSIYASATQAKMILGNQTERSLLKTEYDALSSSLATPALSTANSEFKEGNY